MNTYEKHKLKRRHLTKKLFYELAKSTLDKNIIERVKFQSLSRRGSCQKADIINYDVVTKKANYTELKINLNFQDVSDFSNNRIGRAYYKNRPEFLKTYVFHNRKNALRFILLHELYHAKKRFLGHVSHSQGYFEEIQADRHAIDNLKRYA